jgi:hypothetical protein
MTKEEIEIWNAAVEAAARAIEEFHVNNLYDTNSNYIVHPIAVADAKRIRKLKKK